MGECTHMVDTGLTAGMTPSLSLRDEAPLPALRVTFSRGTGEGEMGEMVLAPTGGGGKGSAGEVTAAADHTGPRSE
jgi:hypothetical protein